MSNIFTFTSTTGVTGHGGHWDPQAQAFHNPLIGAYNAYNGAYAQSLAAAQAQYAAYANQAAAYQPKPEPIEDAGISVGEIVAWRCWRLQHGFLTSMAVESVWAPKEAMEGDVSHSGVHAWKKSSSAIEYGMTYLGVIVIGTVKLWGEVIEHDRGYRAQFGKIASLDFMLRKRFFEKRALSKLRNLYAINGQS